MEKHIFLRLNFDDAPEDLQEGDYTHALNLVPAKGGVGMSGGRENIKGTESVGITLPVGLNTCIGKVVYQKKNQLIFFVHNDKGSHSVCKWDYGKSTADKLLEWSGFNFKKSNLIKASIVDHYLVWVDGANNARIIDLDKISDGFYTNLSEYKISLIKRGSIKAPSASRVVTSQVSRSYISDTNLQFATRFIYFDNQYSPLSPYSPLLPADPVTGLNGETDAAKVSFSLSNEELAMIKNVQVLVRTSNHENFSIAETIKVDGAKADYEYYYFGNKGGSVLSDNEMNLSTNTIPNTPNNVAYLQSRLFLGGGSVGQEDLGSVTLATTVERGNYTSRQHAKEGGLYEVGLILYDENMKSVGVVKSSDIEVPAGSFTDRGHTAVKPYIKCALGGTLPSWAKHYSLAIKREKTKQAYFQCPVNVYFYVSDNKYIDRFGNVQTVEVSPDLVNISIHNERLYLKNIPDNLSGHSYLHLHLPTNVPFLPDTGYYVRILNNLGVTVSDEPIVDVVDGDKLVIKNFGITDFTKVSTMKWFIEVYSRRKETQDELFFETSNVYPIVDGAFSSPNLFIEGDTYNVTYHYEAATFNFDERSMGAGSFTYGFHDYFRQKVESPTPCFSPLTGGEAFMSVPKQRYTSVEDVAILGVVLSKKTQVSANTEEATIKQPSNYVLDYSKIASCLGRPTLKPNVFRRLRLDNSIRFGSTYVENSTVNGLASFNALDDFNISSEQGKNSILLKAENVLLAINERSTTSIYINEAFLSTSDGQQFLTKTESVISDNRELKGSYGTVNPESVATNGDVVYWVDLHKGEVLRYNNGLHPIASLYKAKSYFKKKCEERAALFHLNPKIHGGYDPYLEMYLVTFAPVGNLPGETIGFSESYKSWISFYSFIPESFGNLNKELLSWKNGIPYRHQRGDFNKFYGQAYPSSIEFVSNPEVDFEKSWENVATDSNIPWGVPAILNENGQSSDLVAGDFKRKGSAFYADLLRDKNTPFDLMKPGQLPLRHGKKLRSQTLRLRLETNNQGLNQIHAVYTGYLKRSGQLIN